MTTEAIVVPLKRFDLAKDRLRQGADLDVTALAEELARNVLCQSRPRHVIVLSEHPEVARFASSLGAEIWSSRATSLNEAVQGAYRGLGERFERLIIAHGDLRYPEGLGDFAPEPGITVVTDHRGEGTNVLVLPTGLNFHFAYGTGSRLLHVEQARLLGVPCRVVSDSPWRYDVDELSDLQDP
jgi:2-phospho-L-lactate guanylyltransferase (CobY/MobA/RfbA family)